MDARGKRIHQGDRGFSAVELLIVLAVVVVVLVVSWPRLRAWRGQMLDQDLVAAMEEGDRDGALLALKRGASPDGWSGATPHFCLRCRVVLENDLEMAELVFPKGQRGSRVIPAHQPPLLNLAVVMGNTEMASILLESDEDVNLWAVYGFHRYILSGSPGAALKEFNRLIQAYSGVGMLKPTTLDEMVPRIVAAYELVEENPSDLADLNVVNTRENVQLTTLLHDAVVLKDPAMLRLLLAHGVDPNLENEQGETAHALALRLGYREEADILAAAGG